LAWHFIHRPSDVEPGQFRPRFLTKQNHGERLLPGNLAGEADRLVLAANRPSDHRRKADQERTN
jgi:hypothetical protein